MNNRQRRILAETYQNKKGHFVLREYVKVNRVDKDTAKAEIKELIDLGVVEIVGTRKAAKYYPLLQRASLEEKLREHFSRKEYLTNTGYRGLAGNIHVVTASVQLRKLVSDGLLRKEGKGRGTRYYPTGKLLKTK